MPIRVLQILLTVSILWLSWLVMTIVHEGGHVAGAVWTGGTVQRVVWHPTILSRTDVFPNPSPLTEVWSGPLLGILLPLVVAGGTNVLRPRVAYLAWVVAGFCLIANGAYIGVGAIWPVGDASELIAHGSPRSVLAIFGAVAVFAGFWIWHRASPHLGFGPNRYPVIASHAYVVCALTVMATIVGFAAGDRGLAG